MNAHINITPAAEAATIKLPRANAAPSYDLAEGLAALRVVMELMGDDKGMNKEFIADLHAVLTLAKERIDPVFDLLDSMDLIDEYRASRTEALIAKRRA